MAAYMLVIARVTDRERFMAGYAVQAGALVEQFGGRYVLRAPNAIALEGALGDGRSIVISEWPDMSTAKRFWESPEYREVAELRRDICDAEVLLVEGELSQTLEGAA
ncbi:MAG: DUF1330 domain-containing protein [Congregibacter sp.]